MDETTILLSPSPGDPSVKPDFLATVEPVTLIPSNSSASSPPQQSHSSLTLPFEIVLDGYTREPWSSGKQNDKNKSTNNNNDDCWQSGYLVSTDGRNRLPGFFQFLQSRKKAAMAKFEPSPMDASGVFSSISSNNGTTNKAILVVPFDPPPIPDGMKLPEGVDQNQLLFVKYLRDEGILKRRNGGGSSNDVLKQQQLEQQQKMQQQKILQEQERQKLLKQKQLQQQKMQQQQSTSNKKGGFLGSLLGAQRRTENHLSVVRTKKQSSDPFSADLHSGAAGVYSSFRQKVASDLEQFKSDPNTFITKVSISLASLVQSVSVEERDKITMDALKYIVHEQVEEVGMDKWIAAKEPGAFMDESVIGIYKEGHCPPEILEELNKGELPDEIKGQQRHLQEAQSKALQRKDKKQDAVIMKQSMGSRAADVAVLNTNKRDRRTLEQIQKDLLDGNGDDGKRGRFE